MAYLRTNSNYERPHPLLPRGYTGYPDRHLGRPVNVGTLSYGPGGGLIYGSFEHAPGTHLASVPPLAEPIKPMGRVVHPETGTHRTPPHNTPTGLAPQNTPIEVHVDLPFSCYDPRSQFVDPFHVGIPIGTLGRTTVTHSSLRSSAPPGDLHSYASYSALNAHSRSNYGLSKVGK